MHKTLVRAGLAALTLALLSTSCTKKKEVDENLFVLNAILKGDLSQPDPADTRNSADWEVFPNVFDTLYQYSYLADPYKTEPLLAADLPKLSPDRLTVTIRVKPGTKFQDDPCFKDSSGAGREVKAQDFVYAFKRLLLPGFRPAGAWVLENNLKGVKEFREKIASIPKAEVVGKFADVELEGVKATDAYTLQLRLVRPYPQLLYVLALPFTAPVPAEAVAAYGDETGRLTQKAIGTGPFSLAKWEQGKRVTLERNPTYHVDFYPIEATLEARQRGMLADGGKPLPFVDRIVWEVMPDEQPRWLRFNAGQTDLLELPESQAPAAFTPELKPELAARGIRVASESSPVLYYLAFNSKDKLVGQNRSLRQAISSALNRDEWVRAYAAGAGRKANQAIPPGVADRLPELKAKLKYDFDLERAQQLLKKAGYPEGKGLPELSLDLRGSDAAARLLGEYFTGQFAAVGLKLNVIYNTLPAFLEKVQKSNFQMAYGGWQMDYPDPANVFQLLYGPNRAPGTNESNFDNAEMNQLYAQLSTLEPGSKRAAVVEKMDAILQEEVPWALGFYPARRTLTQPWLLNLRPSEVITNKYKYLRVNRDVKKRFLEKK